MTIVTRPSAVKQISSHSNKTQSQRPQWPPRPDRYRPLARPPRYMLDTGKQISLLLTLQHYGITPNKATLTKIGGDE